MMNRRSFILRSAIAALSPTAFASNPIEAVTLNVLASPYMGRAAGRMLEEFSRSQVGIRTVLMLGAREDEQTLEQLLLDRLVGSKLPDVAILGGNLTRSLAEHGLAVPLDPSLGASTWPGDLNLSPTVTTVGEVGPTRYGLSIGLSLPVILFNSSLVRKVGFDPAHLPTDWSAIIALAKRIDALDRSIVGGFIEYDGGTYNFFALLGSFGGTIMSADERRIAFDSPEGVRGLDVLRGFGQAGQARADMTRDQARQAFGAGAIGVFVTMSSTTTKIENASNGSFSVAATPFPVSSPAGWLPAAGPVSHMLTRDSQKQQAALDFIRFASGRRGQAIMADASAYVPINEDTLRTALMPGGTLSRRKYADAYLIRRKVARNWYSFPRASAMEVSDLIRNRLQSVVSLQEAPAVALARLAEDIGVLLFARL